ncbi:MAG: hypothetical protein QM713_04720 [Arachnia sp.]
MLELDGIRVDLPGRGTAIDDLRLTADTGRVTALVGPGGRGTSTLFALLARDAPPGARFAGRALLDGVDLLAADPGDVALRVLLVDPAAPDPRSVREALAELDAVADDEELADRLDRPVSSLPPDLRARLALAELRLAPRTSVVLVDQVMAAADPALRHDLGRALRARAADGAHVLWAEHQLDAVWAFADDVAEPGEPTIPLDDWQPATVREPTLLTLARVFGLPRGRCRTPAAVRRLVGSPALTRAVPSGRRVAHAPEVTVDAAELGLSGRQLDILPGEAIGVVHRSGRAEPVARRLVARLGGARVPSVLPEALTPVDLLAAWDARHRTAASGALGALRGVRPWATLATHSSGERAALRMLLARETPGAVWLPQPQLGLDQTGQIAAQRALADGSPGIRIVTSRDVEFLVRACRRIAVVDGEEIVAFGSPGAVQHALPALPLTAQALPRTAPTRLGEIIESAAVLSGGAA